MRSSTLTLALALALAVSLVSAIDQPPPPSSPNECFKVVDGYQDYCTPASSGGNSGGEVQSQAECAQYYDYLASTGEAVNAGGMEVFSNSALQTGCTRTNFTNPNSLVSYTDVYYNGATSGAATVDVFRVCRCIQSPPPPPPPPSHPPLLPPPISPPKDDADSTILVAVLLTAIPIVALGLIGYVAFLFFRHPKQPALRATGNAPTLARMVPVPNQDKGQFSFYL